MQVDLHVRGICCLLPGVEGVSENIRVVSIVGRLLEHSRVYTFRRDGEYTIYISSADLMPRNLDHRVELAAPIESPEARAELLDALERGFADNQNAWSFDNRGVWHRRTLAPGEQPRSLQLELAELHAIRAGADRMAGSICRRRYSVTEPARLESLRARRRARPPTGVEPEQVIVAVAHDPLLVDHDDRALGAETRGVRAVCLCHGLVHVREQRHVQRVLGRERRVRAEILGGDPTTVASSAAKSSARRGRSRTVSCRPSFHRPG